jgi:hypothetical protein
LLYLYAGGVGVAGHDPVRKAAAVRFDILAHLPDVASAPTSRSGR